MFISNKFFDHNLRLNDMGEIVFNNTTYKLERFLGECLEFFIGSMKILLSYFVYFKVKVPSVKLISSLMIHLIDAWL